MVRSSQKDKSSSTLRKDPAWKHSTQVDIGGDKTYVYLKCNYCDKIVKGGVTRIKEHLSCSHKNVALCEKVPDVVRKEIREFMNRTSSAKNLSKQQFEDRIDPGSFFASEHSGRDSTPTFPPSSSRGLRGPMDHYMVQPAVDTSRGLEADTSRMIPTEQAKEARRRVSMDIGRFFYESSYKEIWGIIDERWELQLHRHLHAAGYYLNPQFQYADNSSTHPEIKLGLYHCMDRLIADAAERGTADVQLIAFRNKEGFFGLQQAKDTITKQSPVEWWIQFGDGTPELQRFAIKILGLTCSSSACERNWSTYNQIHTKRRNRLSTLRMNSLAYIMYNKKLKDRSLKKKAMNDGEDPLLCEDIPSDDEWFIDDENDVTTPEFHQEDLNVDFFTTERQRPTTSSDPKQKGKRKNIEIEEEEEDWEALESFEPEDEGIEAGQTHIDTDEDPLNFDDLL